MISLTKLHDEDEKFTSPTWEEIKLALVIPDLMCMIAGYHLNRVTSSVYSISCIADDQMDDLKWVQTRCPSLDEYHFQLACESDSYSSALWISRSFKRGIVHWSSDIFESLSDRTFVLVHSESRMPIIQLLTDAMWTGRHSLLRKLITTGISTVEDAFHCGLQVGGTALLTLQYLLERVCVDAVRARQSLMAVAKRAINEGLHDSLGTVCRLSGPRALRTEDVEELYRRVSDKFHVQMLGRGDTKRTLAVLSNELAARHA